MYSAYYPIVILLMIAVLTPLQCVLIWLGAKVVDAPNSDWRAAVNLSLLLAVGNIGYASIARYYEPQAIPSEMWLIIAVGFCAYLVTSFWLTMSILGVGLLRAFLVGLVCNVCWKLLAAGFHLVLSR
jgi:hypothetical protein